MDGTDLHSLLLGERSYQVLASKNGTNGWSLHLSGRHLMAQVVDERTRSIREVAGLQGGPRGTSSLKAPMPGMVVKVEVREGDQVMPGQGLVIVEAMKMENELKAEGEGRVSKILVEPGQAVDKDQVLIEFAPQESVSEKEPGDE